MRTASLAIVLLAILFCSAPAEARACGGYYEQVVHTYWVPGYWHNYWVNGYYDTRVRLGRYGQAEYYQVWVPGYWDSYWVNGYWDRHITQVWRRDYNCGMCRRGLAH